MNLLYPILYWTAAIASLAGAPRADELADHVVFEKDDALYGRIGSSSAVDKLSDQEHFERADRAEGRSYVLLRFDDHRTWLTVLDCDTEGNLKRVRTVLNEKLDDASAILDAEFLPDGKLFVVLHVDTALKVALVLDPRTNQRTFLIGNEFTWDKSGKHVAYFFVDPSGAVAENAPEQIWIDGRKVCDGPVGGTGNLTWDESGANVTATFPQPGKKDLSLVVRAANGAAVAQLGGE